MKKSTAKISTMVVFGGTLASLPAAALELGDIQVRSHLGQPLRASVAYALAPNEALSNTCVSVGGGRLPGSAPGIGDTAISVANGIISITGKSAIREPLVSVRLNVHCPYAASISRDYTLFVDPAGINETAVTTQAVAPAVRRSTTTVSRSTAAATARSSGNAGPVVEGTRYQVQPGESVSEIAQRIENRPVGLWPAVYGILAANPDAFLDNDPNRLKAGSWLTIPDFGAQAPLTVAPATTVEPVASAPAPTAITETAESSVYTGTTVDQAAVPVEEHQVAPQELQVPEPVEVPAARVIDIPDVELPAPESTATNPNVATARVQRTPAVESGTNWLAWLGGFGLGLIALLLFFGRQVRNRFGASPIGEARPQERRQPDSTRSLEVVSEMEVSIGELDETEENLALDADLIIGSGLQESNEVDIAQDFGFAETTKLDHEFPDEMISETPAGDTRAETDIIPPLNIEAQSILESEVLPDEVEDEDDDYDMSVIVDATKVPDPDDATLRDLEAVPVDTGDDSMVSGDYTVNSEADYTVLEQDYQDELSATQKLNEEIARAATQLTDSMEIDDADTSIAEIAALDVTAQMPANDDEDFDFGDGDDDEVTAKFRAQRGNE